MRLKMTALSLIVITAQVASVAAQTSPDSAPGAISGPPGIALPLKSGMIGRRIDNMDATPLKGAPFCAVIATEHTQVFADGNRIHTTDNSTLCRDSQGRTRREAGLNLLGFTPQKSGTRLITPTTRPPTWCSPAICSRPITRSRAGSPFRRLRVLLLAAPTGRARLVFRQRGSG